MARLLKHILLFAASLISLIVLTVNYFNIKDSYYERQSYVQDYDVYDAYKISIKENYNLSYKLCDENDLAEYSNHIANMPCAVFKGNYYRKKANKNPEHMGDKWRTISEWDFFINVYETELPIESASSYFKGISEGVDSFGIDLNSVQYDSYQGFPTLRHCDLVNNISANTIVIVTDNLAYHITAIDASEIDELDVLLNNLNFDIPPEITSLPWIMIVTIIILEICLIFEVIMSARDIKGVGDINKVARIFTIFTFAMICTYAVASIIHTYVAINDLKGFYNGDHILFIWLYPGVVFSLILLYHRLIKDSNSNTGVGFVLPVRWKSRLKDSAISRLIVVVVCYPCLIALILAGFLAVPFVLIVYVLFLLGYVITHSVRWIIAGSIN